MKKKVHKDFHGALSAGFEFLDKNYGRKVLEEYLVQLAENVYGKLIEDIKKKGLGELEKYWNKIFTDEDGKFSIERDENRKIKLTVRECPAISHMKKKGYKIYKNFCIQCEVINKIIADKTGYTSEIEYDVRKGKCSQKLYKNRKVK